MRAPASPGYCANRPWDVGLVCSISPEDWVIPRTQQALCRTSVLLLLGVSLAGGCGSSASSQRASSQTDPHGPSVTVKGQHGSVRGSPGISRAGGRGSGIKGEAVTAQCAVLPAGERTCPRRGVRATFEVLQSPSGHAMAIVRTDRGGRFRLSLPPGAYRVASRTPGLALYAPPVTLRVRSHAFAHVEIEFLPAHPFPVAPGPTGCKACPPPPPTAP